MATDCGLGGITKRSATKKIDIGCWYVVLLAKHTKIATPSHEECCPGYGTRREVCTKTNPKSAKHSEHADSSERRLERIKSYPENKH